MNRAFEIVFNDDYLVGINKIAKILVQPSSRKEETTLTSLLQKESGEKIFPCHRLDRETTGLIIYAKSNEIQREITEEFERKEIKKKYAAFIKGRLRKKRGLLEDYIIDREGKIFGEKPKKAQTIYRVLEEFGSWSLIELEPLTGRTNQLRIQLAKIGHPILGEGKYAVRRDFSNIGRLVPGGRAKLKRLALHAFHLSFIHPVSKERVNLNIDLASDMKEFLKHEYL